MTIHLGFRDVTDGVVKDLDDVSPIELSDGQSVVLPEGLFRRFSGGDGDAVQGISIRARG